MPDAVTYLGLIIGFGVILVAGARLGAGSHQALAGLFVARGVRDWPIGVQEGDAPRFAVGHLDGLRHGHPMLIDRSPTGADDPLDMPRADVIDLGCRRLDVPRV